MNVIHQKWSTCAYKF